MTPDQLPPLPERRIRHVYNESKGYSCDCWTEDAVREYATAATAALRAELDALRGDAERYRWLAAHARSTAEHWGGRWSLVIEGPAPERHDCEDALDAAIDAAMKETP